MNLSSGLVIRSRTGAPLFEFSSPFGTFDSYEEVPPIVVQSLLFIENRKMLVENGSVRSNPVIEWDRLAEASLLYFGRKIGFPLPLEGGSTLATQIEKYQHSKGGRTRSSFDKLRQMLSASLKVYHDGNDTRAARRQIVLHYVNTVPLSGTPGYGEVHGLKEGLYAWFGLRPEPVLDALRSEGASPEKAQALKYVLSLLAAAKAPDTYLSSDHAALESRVKYLTALLMKSGIIEKGLAEQVNKAPLIFARRAAHEPPAFTPAEKTRMPCETGWCIC